MVDPSVAIALIAFGHLARESLVSLCVRSIRKPGGWLGPVYLLTDAPKCAPASVSVVAVLECEALMAKELKMRVLEVTTEAYVLYMDVDVVVGKPLTPFVYDGIAKTRSASIVLYGEAEVTPDPTDVHRLEREPYHGGIFAVARGGSDACLASWRAKVVATISRRQEQDFEKKQLRDQPLLRECVDEKACTVAFFDKATLVKPGPAHVENRNYSVLNHLSRTSRLRHRHNKHNLTAAHLEMVATDLLHLPANRARQSWWHMPATCARNNTTTSSVVCSAAAPPPQNRTQQHHHHHHHHHSRRRQQPHPPSST